MQIKDTDIIILCGGLGIRLRPIVGDCPKILAPINGKPFIDILMGQLKNQGFKNIILSIGYLGEKIKEHCKNNPTGLNIKFAEELEPLGTGGALKNSLNLVKSDPFITMNGDNIFDIDFRLFLDFYSKHKPLAAIALSKQNQKKSGKVYLTSTGQIKNFNETNTDAKDDYVNAGIYIFRKEIKEYMPKQKKFSLEYDLFPSLTGEKFLGFVMDKPFLDFGTPDNFRRAIEKSA